MEGMTQGRLNRDGIRIHEPADFEGMRAAGRLVADILDRIAAEVAPGVETIALDGMIHDMIRAAGAVSATIGYKGYRHASCISINHVVCHGIPSDKRLRDGTSSTSTSRWCSTAGTAIRAGCSWRGRRAARRSG